MKIFSYPPKLKTHLDILKILAIFLVLLNHSTYYIFRVFATETEQPWHWLSLGHSAFIKAAVPLFLMASGALLLGGSESYSRIFTKRVLRFALTLAAVSLILYVRKYQRFDLVDFLKALYLGNISTHLWYLYAYICLLLTLPFLRRMAQGMRLQDAAMLVFLTVLANGLQFCDHLFFQSASTHIWSFTFFTNTTYVIYPLLGYFLEHKLPRNRYNLETAIGLLLASLLALYVTCVMTDWRCKVDGGWTGGNEEAYLSSLVVFPAIAVYYTAKYWFLRHPVSQRTARVLFIIASCTFGTYLFEGVFRAWTPAVFDLLEPLVGSYFAAWLQMLASCVLGIALTFLFKYTVAFVKACFVTLIEKIKDAYYGE